MSADRIRDLIRAHNERLDAIHEQAVVEHDVEIQWGLYGLAQGEFFGAEDARLCADFLALAEQNRFKNAGRGSNVWRSQPEHIRQKHEAYLKQLYGRSYGWDFLFYYIGTLGAEDPSIGAGLLLCSDQRVRASHQGRFLHPERIKSLPLHCGNWVSVSCDEGHLLGRRFASMTLQERLVQIAIEAKFR